MMFRYTMPQILLHWIVALLIALQFVLPAPGLPGGDAGAMGAVTSVTSTATPEGAVTTAPASTAAVTAAEPAKAAVKGGTPIHVPVGIAILALMLVRLFVLLRSSAAPVDAGLLGLAARWVHRLLYALLILAPIGGIMAWGLGIREAGKIHAVLGNAVFILVGLHIAAALYHQFIVKDGLLRRMMPH